MNHLPRIALTTGDPAGIGPEVCLKWLRTFLQPATSAPLSCLPCLPLLFGDAVVFDKLVQTPPLRPWAETWRTIEKLSWETYLQSPDTPEKPTLIDMQGISAADILPGQISAPQGQAAYFAIQRAIAMALAGHVDALVTGPIHKEALHAAKIPYPGHTEILTDQTGAGSSVMMLSAPQITCSLVTAHVGLADVPSLLSTDRILETIQLTDHTMQVLRGQKPRLTICGLNPHAGEHGLFGNREEERFILPAVASARQAGIEIAGPFPPDTAFLPARRATTDAYICMYHDQGLIPLKALAFDDAVNITLGLPIIRTSVDHGTAFDIAWQGIASESSLIHAVNLACQLSQARLQ